MEDGAVKTAGGPSSAETLLLASAKCGDRDALRRLIELYRRELQLHCYRMLGTYHDAEDLVQETFVRAWRGLEQFDGRASVRYWLYRIATNACLSALAARSGARRVLPETHGPSSDRMPDREPAYDVPWLDPYPDSALDGIPDASPGPDARYEMREAIQLAFMSVIHYLPPRQRAALLLRGVLGWSAAESAQLLERRSRP
jgi:RNA polymerase sigma-70 factor (ECF subfamily)